MRKIFVASVFVLLSSPSHSPVGRRADRRQYRHRHCTQDRGFVQEAATSDMFEIGFEQARPARGPAAR